MNEEMNPHQIYADLPEEPVFQSPPPRQDDGSSHTSVGASQAPPRRSPAVGTIAFGLAIIVVGVGLLLGILAGFSPDPRAAGAAFLATFGALLVLSSGIGLFLHRGGRRLKG